MSNRHYAESGTSAVYWDDPVAPSTRENIVKELSPWNLTWHSADKANACWVEHTAQTIMQKSRKQASYAGCFSYWLWVQDQKTAYRNVDCNEIGQLLELAGWSIDAFACVFIETTVAHNLRDRVVWRIRGGRVQILNSVLIDSYFPDETLREVWDTIKDLIIQQDVSEVWYSRFASVRDRLRKYYCHRVRVSSECSLDSEMESAVLRLSNVFEPHSHEEWVRLDTAVRGKVLHCLQNLHRTLQGCLGA